MKRHINYLRLAGAAGLASFLLVATNGFAKTPKPVKLKGSGVAYFATNNFSFDNKAPAELVIASGKDNLGASNQQAEVEIGPTSSGGCTAPDGTAGLQYDVVGAAGQAFYASKATIVAYDTKGAGSECVSNTTGLFNGSLTYDLVFVNGNNTPTDSITVTFTGGISGNGALTGGYGFLGAESWTTSGTITK